ncbi:MAG: FixG Ig-like domain-containing protein, partial [Sulfurimicrobium sp.]
GRSAVGGESFRKRVLYLSEDWLPAKAAEAAVAQPLLVEPASTRVVSVSLIADPEHLKPGSIPVHIRIQDVENPGVSVNEKTSFLVR